MKPPPVHRVTTAQLQAVYPFVSEGGWSDGGPLIGRDLFGGSFCFDPWLLYRRGVVTNPNLLVLGQVGRGKSTFVKTFVWRQVAFGRQAWIVDPKGEYDALARACGTVPLRLVPGGAIRLNPLDLGPMGPGLSEPYRHGGPVVVTTPPEWRQDDPKSVMAARDPIDSCRAGGEPGAGNRTALVHPAGRSPAGRSTSDRSPADPSPADPSPADTAFAGPPTASPPQSVMRRQVELACSLSESSLGRLLTPPERTAVELAIRAIADRREAPTLPLLVAALLDPDRELAATVRTDAAGLARDGRLVALELRRLVEGDLAGMFDGPTSVGLRLDTPVVVLDLSAVFTSPALAVLMTCAGAWLQAILADRAGPKRVVVVDEAWAVLHDLATARWLQATFKLARAIGVANVAVVHRLSDLTAAGTAGSVQQRLAEGLLADAETRVVFGQAPSEAEATQRLLGLTETERDLVARLPRGVALWKVGARSLLVEHYVGQRERGLVDTDAAMTENPVGPTSPSSARRPDEDE